MNILAINMYIDSVVLPALIGVCASFLIEFSLLVPRQCIRLLRGATVYLLHIASWLSFFLLCLLLFQRPWFAVLLTTSLQLLLMAVNFVKYRTLREPFILQDFEYFSDMIMHPRLYLPFFGIWNALIGCILFTFLVYIALRLEASLLLTVEIMVFFGLTLSLLLGTGAIALIAARSLPEAKLDPVEDLRLMGLFSSFWCYFMAFTRCSGLTAHPVYQKDFQFNNIEVLPDLMVVQSESFFDPRLSFNSVREDVLQHYDRIVKQSLSFGRVIVPAWGANTVRTESSFLTGLNSSDMGIHQFNPYWYLTRNSLPNLVSQLKSLGYRTICIHPYPAAFYHRDTVFPQLGFDQFIDIREFSPEQKNGQYISDLAVAEKAKEVMDKESSPCFVFAITMENHGPLHLESNVGIDTKSLYHTLPPEEARDLTVYLKHLKNADNMIDQLTTYLNSRQRKSYLCWYGDHVPVMTKVYKVMGEPVEDTPFFIWCNQEELKSKESIYNIDQLSVNFFIQTVANKYCTKDLIGKDL
ncbi:LTA synthase family protein [Amphritea sp.]|uniref:LTA synthase family protein n=1 Tax=Amphritea sp. TaxID=1872502 RepID=UPI003A927E5E